MTGALACCATVDRRLGANAFGGDRDGLLRNHNRSVRYSTIARVAIAEARRIHRPMDAFTTDLGLLLGWPRLGRQTVYQWEWGASRIPAIALLAAADMTNLSLDDLLRGSDCESRNSPRQLDDWER